MTANLRKSWPSSTDAEQGNQKRIALYGGSFNPPHYGHFIAAFYAYHFLKVDEVWMMVTPQNPLKDPEKYAPLTDRVDMCNALAEEHPWLKVTDIEKDFENAETADTLKRMKEIYPENEFVWVMGADNLATFHEWTRWQEIIDNHAIAVLARSEKNEDGENECLKTKALESPAALYASRLRVDQPQDLAGHSNGWCFIDTPAFDISSSAIVEQLQDGENDLRDLLDKVEKIIFERGLYGVEPKALIKPTPSSQREPRT